MITVNGMTIRLTDFHSHVLPEMDDGSQSLEESLEMLKLLRAQGVDAVVLTPHFYPKNEDPVSFLERRAESETKLIAALQTVDSAEVPQIFVGAEVAYFPSISHSKNIRELCIRGTDTMLLEMPFERWTDTVIGEVIFMRRELGMNVVLAHIDRYFNYLDSTAFARLISAGVYFQVNADAFSRFFLSRKLYRLMYGGNLHALGSDCHNLTSRPSHMDVATDRICEKGYAMKLKGMMQKTQSLLNDAEPLV